jgi:hypothetical protein
VSEEPDDPGDNEDAGAERSRKADQAAETNTFAGMTLNERLQVRGLFPEWDAAVERKDRDALLSLLKSVEVDDPEWVADEVLRRLRRAIFWKRVRALLLWTLVLMVALIVAAMATGALTITAEYRTETLAENPNPPYPGPRWIIKIGINLDKLR